MSASRTPFRVGRAGRVRGVRYGPAAADLEARVERWLAERTVDDGLAIKLGRVYRRGPHVVKFLPAGTIPFRPSGATRLAELALRLAPLRTPAPVLAAELPGGLRAGPSVLVSTFVEGRDLAAAWGRDARAEAAFPALLAAMHRRRLFHGDLHPQNLLWDGSEWFVLDIGALRHPLRTWRPQALAEAQWAELDFRLGSPPSLRAAFDTWRRALDLRGDADRAWSRIATRSAVLRASRS